MNRASLIDNFERKGVVLTPQEKERILASFNTVYLKKKDQLLVAGEVCNFQAFVVTGCCKVYFLDSTGQEHIIYFAIEDWWLADLESYHLGIPSKFYIQAIEDCELLMITKEVKEPLYKEIPVLERIYRLMLGQECVALQRRIVNKLSMDATAEYDDFCKRYPSLLSRLTNIQIASYLGISQEFLSKIKSKKK
ncbi:Crp/Fnr family transcriptional regulator [Myroides odoratimimus]|uniref:Crp/Fnr family transcriptional regulator n=1 Tax=Myroides odoratimimus TaxID=76832 RepID=UPI0025766C90|nr:Crp/Fnr family transcriptional regulator [Myroides odoratimimus]MDM1451633.1 Crp/Fnr family transcriptional regulator [Myroides odoratimimus]MDM1530578.1 Crp/Fnr family transcriptional regulator [Myroides odoratimimus]